MRLALALAEQAAQRGEVPVGAVLVQNGVVIGQGHNLPIAHHDPTAHAEVLALRSGAQALANYRLTHTTLYVTLEPCIMCAGAILHARVQRLVYGASDPRAGAVHSVYPILAQPRLNHAVMYTGGVLESDCAALLKQFFRSRRGQK